MILTIIRDKEQDLELAGIAAAAICGAGLTQAFPGGLPSRGAVADGGSLGRVIQQDRIGVVDVDEHLSRPRQCRQRLDRAAGA